MSKTIPTAWLEPLPVNPIPWLQVSLLEDLSARKSGAALVDADDEEICRPLLQTPLVLAAWKERADVLWGETVAYPELLEPVPA